MACIIGSSGSGKSTLLRCINLLETPDAGEILFHGKNVLSGDVSLGNYHARVGMVFQQFNLFNNMTVLKNCMVGQMKVLKRSAEESRENASNTSSAWAWSRSSTPSRASSPADRSSAWPSPAPWP